jgi:hypothetical protein
MPYITEAHREYYKEELDILIDKLKSVNFPAGDVNYIVSMIVANAFKNKECYQTANDMIGALEACKIELYRRLVSDYEDLKIKSNGDIPPYEHHK